MTAISHLWHAHTLTITSAMNFTWSVPMGHIDCQRFTHEWAGCSWGFSHLLFHVKVARGLHNVSWHNYHLKWMLRPLLCALPCLNQCIAFHSKGLCPIIVGWQRHLIARGGDTAEAWAGCCLENMACRKALEGLTTNPNLTQPVGNPEEQNIRKKKSLNFRLF